MTPGPVFLSASIPDPTRDPKYFQTGDTIAIRDAVIALVTAVLPRTKLVFGGHPAITPMVKWVADRTGSFNKVRMFQSKWFQDKYLPDLAKFRYEETEAATDRDQSLLAMRKTMLTCENFSAAFFIGGMEGVEDEYDLMGKLNPTVPRFPVYTTGAAARLLWQREWDANPYLRETELNLLRRSESYQSLFTKLLDDTTAIAPTLRPGA